MRQLNNKQFDTKEGASASLSELSHPQLAPSVSQKDEKMKKSILIIWFKLIYRLTHFTLNIYLKASDALEANKIKKPHVSTKIDMSYRRMFFIDCLVGLNRGRVLTNTVNKIVYRNKTGK